MGYLVRQHWRDAQRWHETGLWRSDTLPGMLAAHSAARAAAVAMVDGDLRITWAQLRAAAGRFAADLVRRGITDGDPLVVCLPDGAAFVAVAVGAQAIRAVTAPLARGTGDAELLAVVARTNATAVVCDRHLELPPDVQLILVGQRDRAFWVGEDASLPPDGQGPDPDLVSDIMFTSGTTGRPKGVMNTTNTKLTGLRGLLAEFEFSAEEVWGIVAPLSHNAGWLYTALPALATGARSVIVDRGDPYRMLDTLEREGVTATFLVPTHLVDLLRTYRAHPGRWSLRLRYVLTGAAAAAQDAIRGVREEWGALPISLYGMTECQANLFTRANDPIDVIATSVGRPCPGAEVALRDPATGAMIVDEGIVGEIVTRGATTFVGYFDDQRATTDSFTRDGWFRSGDLALVADGAFRVVGRLKEVILRGGTTIVPKDVEAAVATYPGIGETAVIGIPDERLGERVCVCVSGGLAPTREELLEFLRSAGYGRQVFPDEIVRVDAFPRTGLGKVQRSRLRDEVVRLTGASG